MIFVLNSDQDLASHAQLAHLIKTASLTLPANLEPRLVVLPKGAEVRLATALQIPRVGMVGLKNGASNAATLLELVRNHVPTVMVPWFEESMKPNMKRWMA